MVQKNWKRFWINVSGWKKKYYGVHFKICTNDSDRSYLSVLWQWMYDRDPNQRGEFCAIGGFTSQRPRQQSHQLSDGPF
jgi:hypothetical protein